MPLNEHAQASLRATHKIEEFGRSHTLNLSLSVTF